jgi:hypothetical protein
MFSVLLSIDAVFRCSCRVERRRRSSSTSRRGLEGRLMGVVAGEAAMSLEEGEVTRLIEESRLQLTATVEEGHQAMD